MIGCPVCGELIADEIIQNGVLWAAHRLVRHTDGLTKLVIALLAAGIVTSARKWMR